MDFLNRIELRGIVGKAEVNTVNGSRVCNFSVVTDYSSRDNEGNPSVESTWFNVALWEGRGGPLDLYTIQKGSWIQVLGRLRTRKYLNQNQEERTSLDVLARSVKLLPRDDDPMQPQRD